MVKRRCDHYTSPACTDCPHAKPHESNAYPFGCCDPDYCGDILEMVRCVPVDEESTDA